MLGLKAPAKINWFLRITGKRADGYHNIVSLMQFITLHDSITIEESDDLKVLTEADIPLHENLVFKAALLLKETTGSRKGALIRLRKDIPLSAGLGGGSSDAVAVLNGLNRLWDINLPTVEISRLAAGLGSDLSFFFNGPAALVEGKGDNVAPAVLKRPLTLLLVKPSFGISSAWAYKEFDLSDDTEELTKKHNNIKLFCHTLDKGDFKTLNDIFSNDLERGVFRGYPVLRDIKQTLLWNGALFSAMSGSGSTVFGVFDGGQAAAEAAKKLPDYWCRVVKTVTNNSLSITNWGVDKR